MYCLPMLRFHPENDEAKEILLRIANSLYKRIDVRSPCKQVLTGKLCLSLISDVFGVLILAGSSLSVLTEATFSE